MCGCSKFRKAVILNSLSFGKLSWQMEKRNKSYQNLFYAGSEEANHCLLLTVFHSNLIHCFAGQHSVVTCMDQIYLGCNYI